MVKEELKITKWLQFMRCTNLALQKLFTKDQLAEIEDLAKFRVITLDA